MASTSHVLQNSYINPFGKLNVKMVIDAILIGLPSTGKTTVINLFQRAISQIEKYKLIKHEQSSIIKDFDLGTIIERFNCNTNLFGKV
jgi:hypothetical protein